MININSDNVFSENELNNLIKEDEDKEKIISSFNSSDKNKDNQLDKEEFIIFNNKHTEILIRRDFRKKD